MDLLMTSHEIKVNLVFNVCRVVYELTWTSVLLFYSLLRRAQPTPHEGERHPSPLSVSVVGKLDGLGLGPRQ